jgi:hypothetical protein
MPKALIYSPRKSGKCSALAFGFFFIPLVPISDSSDRVICKNLTENIRFF